MKPSTVRGTPVRSISGANEGQMAGKPANMSGVVPSQYEGDQSAKVNPRSGTPYNSQNGNPASAKRVASSGKFGDVIDTQTGANFNHPESNGNGVLFDSVGGPSLLAGSPQQTMDSPVPTGAQRPVEDAPSVLANIRSGVGAAWGHNSGPGNNFQEMGGVMSRGMVGTSKPSGPETELTKDDTL